MSPVVFLYRACSSCEGVAGRHSRYVRALTRAKRHIRSGEEARLVIILLKLANL